MTSEQAAQIISILTKIFVNLNCIGSLIMFYILMKILGGLK